MRDSIIRSLPIEFWTLNKSGVIMKIPCTKQCLKYPICKTCEVIKCKDLLEFYERTRDEADIKLTWKRIHEKLPTLKRLQINNVVSYGHNFICDPAKHNGKIYEGNGK